ncbi:MAG: lysophospholipid acyltransferase family protein, partial [bacterium]
YCSSDAQLTSMFAPSGRDELDQWVREAREKFGAVLVPANNRGVAAIIKTLKQNKTVGILPDQVPAPESGEFAPFFERPALTMTLIYNLISRTGAKAIIASATRVRGGFRLTFRQPDKGLYSADENESLSALNKSIEECIAIAPEQYQWEYKRFKKQPQGQPNPYKEKS